MKQHRILFRALSALLCLGLCAALTACGNQRGNDPEPTQDKTYNDSLITEVLSEEGTFTDEFDQDWDYSYYIPQLVSDTADAKAINAEIMERFGDDVAAALESISASQMPQIYFEGISWRSWWNDSLLSLSVEAAGWVDNMSYQVYHYDFASGKRLTNAQVLDRFDVDEADFLAALRRAAAQTYDAAYAPWGVPELSPDDENFGPMCIELASMRAWTVAAENYELESAMFCPNGDGTFLAFQPVGSVAGASWYYREMTVKPAESEWQTGGAQSDYGFVSAVLNDDGPAVYFTRHSDGMFDSEEYRPYVGFSYDMEYPIDGCYGDYEDIFVGTFGNGMEPYAFLLTKDGTVEYVNIFRGFESGILCSGGPLYGLGEIVGFENGEREGGYEEGCQTVYAVDKSGARYDLATRIIAMSNSMPYMVTGDWRAEVTHRVDGGGSYTGTYDLSFSENGFTSVEDVMEDACVLLCGGYCSYLGMTEQGMLYSFNLYNGSEARDGTFTLDFYDSWSDTLLVAPVSGVNLFDAPEGGSTAFTRLYGCGEVVVK